MSTFKPLAFAAIAAALLGTSAIAQTTTPMPTEGADAPAPADTTTAPTDPAQAAPMSPTADPAAGTTPMTDPNAAPMGATGAPPAADTMGAGATGATAGATPPANYPPCRGNVRDSCDQSRTSESRAASAAQAEATGGVGDRAVRRGQRRR